MALQAKGPKEVLEQLADIAKNKLMEYEQKTMAGCLKETPSKVLAANSMYRIAQTILLDQTTTYEEIISVKLFEELSVMIADILTACLTSIPCLIHMECISSIRCAAPFLPWDLWKRF